MPLKHLYVSCVDGNYFLNSTTSVKVLPEVEAAILRIAKAFHTAGIWQAANITAAL